MSEVHNGPERQGRRRGRPRRVFPPAQALAAAQEHLGRNDEDDILVTLAVRILALREQRKSINERIGEVKAEAKDAGFENKILQKRIVEMEMTPEARAEQFRTEHEYRLRLRLGPYIDTPLGEAAMRTAGPQDY